MGKATKTTNTMNVPKKKKVKKSVKKEQTETVSNKATLVPVKSMETQPVTDPEKVSTEVDIETLVAELLKEQVEIAELHKQHTRKIKECMKLYKRERKQLSKKSKKVKDPNAPKKPNAFTTPIKISDKLCAFLKKPKGSLMARTEVTKAISKYIKSNKLFVPENKKQFRPDSYLGNILSPLDGITKDKNGVTDVEKGYTYFNLQRYIRGEFIKPDTSSSNVVNASV